MGILVALPIAAAIAILDRRKIEDFLFTAIGIIVTMIIASGIIGDTMLGVKAGVVLAVISLLYCLHIFFKERERFRECVITPGLLAAAVYITITGIELIGRPDLGGDNDTFWLYAPQVLNLYRYADLGNVGSRAGTFSLLYTPPIFTGWSYFCNKFWYTYSDGISLWARQIFIFAGLMPLFGAVKRGEWKNLVLLLAFVMILPMTVVTSRSFMIDIPVGTTMVYGTVLTIRLFRDKERYNDAGYLLGISIWLMLLMLMKRAGGIYTYGIISVTVVGTIGRLRSREDRAGFFQKMLPFLTICFAVILSMVYCVYRYKYFYDRNLFYFAFPVLGLLLYIVIGIFCAILVRLIATKRYILATVFFGFFCGMMLSGVRFAAVFGREKLLKEELGDINGVFFKFFSWWFSKGRFVNGWIVPDFLYILILLLVVLWLRAFICHNQKKADTTVLEIDRVMVSVFIGYIVYMMFYCFIYMFQQGGYIVGGDIGYPDRYLGPALMLTTAVVFYELLQMRWQNSQNILLFSLIILLLLVPNNPFSFLALSKENYYDKYARLFENSEVEPQEGQWFFCVGPDHCQYYVFPSYGPIDYKVNNAEYTPEEWTKLLQSGSYMYLLLEDYVWDFPEKYQALFEGGKQAIQKWAIYDIVTDGENVRFVKRGGLEPEN